MEYFKYSALNGFSMEHYYALKREDVVSALGSSESSGLSSQDAALRLERYGPNLTRPTRKFDVPTLLFVQFRSPIILILIFAAALSFFLHETTSAVIILAIIFVCGMLGFWQERGAANAVEKLLALVQIKAAVLRDGNESEIPGKPVDGVPVICPVKLRRPGILQGRQERNQRCASRESSGKRPAPGENRCQDFGQFMQLFRKVRAASR